MSHHDSNSSPSKSTSSTHSSHKRSSPGSTHSPSKRQRTNLAMSTKKEEFNGDDDWEDVEADLANDKVNPTSDAVDPPWPKYKNVYEASRSYLHTAGGYKYNQPLPTIPEEDEPEDEAESSSAATTESKVVPLHRRASFTTQQLRDYRIQPTPQRVPLATISSRSTSSGSSMSSSSDENQGGSSSSAPGGRTATPAPKPKPQEQKLYGPGQNYKDPFFYNLYLSSKIAIEAYVKKCEEKQRLEAAAKAAKMTGRAPEGSTEVKEMESEDGAGGSKGKGRAAVGFADDAAVAGTQEKTGKERLSMETEADVEMMDAGEAGETGEEDIVGKGKGKV